MDCTKFDIRISTIPYHLRYLVVRLSEREDRKVKDKKEVRNLLSCVNDMQNTSGEFIFGVGQQAVILRLGYAPIDNPDKRLEISFLDYVRFGRNEVILYEPHLRETDVQGSDFLG